VAILWPLPDRTVAAGADRRLGLRDRIGSALEFVRDESPTGMEQATILDAVHHLDRLRAGEAFPIRLPRGARGAGLCLAALVLVQALPIPPLLLSRDQREARAELREQAAKIEPLAKQMEQAAAEADDQQAQQVARELRKLAQQLNRGKVDKTQALLSMSELQKQLDKLDQRLEPSRPKTAGEAAEKVRQAAQDSMAQKAADLAREAARQGDQKAAAELQKLAEQARKSQDPSELRDLAKQLQQHASKLNASLGLPPDLMAELSAALAEGDLELSQEALQNLTAASQQLAQSDQLSKEELEQLAEQLKELSQALEGVDMKELAQLLQEASECLNAGECDKAGAALGKAYKLCKGGLGKAKLAGACRAASLGLGQCKGGSGFSYGRGGPAPQEHIPANAPSTQLFAPRVNENPGDLARVRGQIDPRGPMMTTTEKGAPVKITASRVPYYEVISDYSKTAEEALSREEVPPSYRSSVRAYFNALQSGAKAESKAEKTPSPAEPAKEQ
jgi:chemotaxis protein histidine kinase CheA